MKNTTSRSFIRRILLIGFFFIVIPLLIYSTLIWQRDWQLKLKSILLEFQLTSEAVSNLYRQWLYLRVYQLDHFTTETEAGLSGKYIFDEEGKSLFSTFPELKGLSPFPKQVALAKERGLVVFEGPNPITQKNEIFVFKKEGNRILGLSVDQNQWITNLGLGRHFTLSLQKGSDPQSIFFSRSELKNWQRKLTFKNAWQLRHHHLSLTLPLSQAIFDLYLTLPESEIAQIEGSPLFQDVLLFILVIFLVGGLSTWWLIHFMSSAFSRLSHLMHAVAQKDYSQRYHRAKLGFEVNQLGENFNHMLDALLLNMKVAEEQKVGKELLAQELTIARDVQKGLLPLEVPSFSGLEWGTAFHPAKEVAGDFYDAFVKDQDQLMVTVADASGKGLSACLYSLIVRSLLRSTALSHDDLASSLSHVNALLIQDTDKTQDFVTAWVGFYNAKNHVLTYASCGHPPALCVLADGTVSELTTEGIALGVTPFEKGDVKSHTLAPGSFVLLYTDGILEAQNEKGELFGKSRLHRVLKESHQLKPQEIINKLLAAVDAFAEQAPQHDDVALLAFKLY